MFLYAEVCMYTLTFHLACITSALDSMCVNQLKVVIMWFIESELSEKIVL